MNYTTLTSAVSNVSGATFVGLDTLTEVKLSGGRSNPHQGRVKKRMIGASVMVFSNKNVSGYEAMVRRRLEQEGKGPDSFVIGPRAWGTRIPNMPIVEHNDSYYLEVIFLKSGRIEYELDGVVVPESAIQGLPVKKDDPYAQGGLDNKVVIRTFSAESIIELRIDGKVYR